MLPRSIRLKPDIIHCHDTLVLPLGVIIKWITNAKLIYDAHELESNRNGLSRIQGWLTLFTEKFFWRFIDALIVVSPSIQSWYVRNIGYKPSAVILNSPQYNDSNGMDDDYFRSKYCIAKDELIFVYVGILGKGRGLDLIVDAFSSSEIKSHVVFLGYGELSDKLENLSRQNKNFHLHPAVPHSEVVPLVRSADFGLCLIQNVSLSDYYCLPNKLFEYCFANIPVLASNFPDIKSLIVEYNAGECCDLNSEAVIKAVKQIEKGVSNYKLNDVRNLSWQAQEIKLLELYADLYRV
jgi:glycosyltransferase involved in cell wall biosynthesis